MKRNEHNYVVPTFDGNRPVERRALTPPPAPKPAARVEARGITKVFETQSGPVSALTDITLTVEPGEFCVIVGPSGCGKTTFLRMLAGLETPSSGSLIVSNTSGQTPSNAMVFQGRSVFPWLSVRQNIAYGLSLRGVPRRTRKKVTDDLLHTVGLDKFGDVFPHQVSEGMRQRVAIARALAVDPDLLLMDEPFGALDEQTRMILQEELLRIWELTGKTVVFITHSIDESLTLADRIVVMSAHPGRVKEIIEVPFARPRELTAVRSDPAFATLFAQVWSSLRDEVTRSRAEDAR
ncbi:MAG: ABC transporter ATP-binding protein [Thermomicrobiales bacterium]